MQSSTRRLKYIFHKGETMDYEGEGRFDIRIKGWDKSREEEVG